MTIYCRNRWSSCVQPSQGLTRMLFFIQQLRMPPTSTNIFQEGAQIKSFKIVSNGQFNQAELKKYLVEEPAQYEGCSGTRCFGDVESDLKAQIAANNKGRPLLCNTLKYSGCALTESRMVGKKYSPCLPC